MATKQICKFKIADCCLNCNFRDGRIKSKVLCSRHLRKSDGNVGWMPERGWCEFYQRSTSKLIKRGEARLLAEMADEIAGL